MKGTTSIWNALCVTAMTFTLVSAAHAGSIHTFASALGNDANTSTNCAAGTPCRSLSATYGVTTAGGDIMLQTPGGYGALTINGPITILGVDGALVAASSGGVAVTVSAAATDKITIRNLVITGDGAASTTGVQLNSGLLVLRDCTIKSATTGISVSSTKADLYNTDITGNTTGVSTTGTGVDLTQSQFTGPTQVRIAGGTVSDNTTAFFMTDPGTSAGGANFGNKFTILEFQTGNSGGPFSTNMTGNGTLITGSGASCAGGFCTTLGTYNGNINPH